ncbi:hypothetical protein NIIDMKKI_53060 [Mycobacterium kansasii]|uniref:Uncharacterized protein n=1 Tax=Mycobacterium kansasii TaxID=1768 RepID=A0A7G1IGZ3_MYCKA|nr:hypothetical protein NIIDMKKI_53060 [Mycobacterium kansasii]
MLVIAVIGTIVLTATLFSGSFKSSIAVTVLSDRAGLVMDRGGKVKLRGVQVGRVSEITAGKDHVTLKLAIQPEQIRYIPANVGARIRATTLFSAKYVDLVYPRHPSPQRLAAGTVLRAENVGTEVNTMFANLVKVLNQIDPAKLQGCCPRWPKVCAGTVRRSARASPTPTRCCSRSIRAPKRSGRTCRRSRVSATPMVLRRKTS